MSTTKHTPGPWHLINTDGGDITVSYSDGVVRSHVARCYRQALAEEHGTLEGNARLIAAAPDLLAACKRVLLNGHICDNRGIDHGCAACDAILDVEMACDKAEGSK